MHKDMEARSLVGTEKTDARVAVDEIMSDATAFVVYSINATENESP